MLETVFTQTTSIVTNINNAKKACDSIGRCNNKKKQQ